MIKIGELKGKKEAELHNLLKEKRSHLRDLKFKTAVGRLADNKEISRTKKEIARILTLLKEKQNA